jgi:predicted N-formylglutamate amidohydrolase
MSDDEFFAPDDPQPVEVIRPDGKSIFVLTADHAGRAIPRRLGTLGLAAAELDTHIAWDIGIAGVARLLSAELDAPLVLQRYSRLVIDCNRDPAVASSIATVSEHTTIPGNQSVTDHERELRRKHILEPYHTAIDQILTRRAAAAAPTIMVALHSMTPVFKGDTRPMHAAVLYDRDARFAKCVCAALREEPGLIVAENQPYFVSPATDYTIPHHAEGRMPYVEIEVRQDLINGESGQRAWSQRLARVLHSAYGSFSEDASNR